jgi:hypothetical protein
MAERLIHRTASAVSFDKDGNDPHWETVCGKRIGGEEGMLLDGDPSHVTCPKCKGKR